MGATGIYTKASFKTVLQDELALNGLELVDSHYVKEEPLNGELEEGHFYTALRTKKGIVFACVVTMVRINRGNKEEVIYRFLDETVGPTYNQCPKHILNKLSPLTAFENIGYAKEWRERQRG